MSAAYFCDQHPRRKRFRVLRVIERPDADAAVIDLCRECYRGEVEEARYAAWAGFLVIEPWSPERPFTLRWQPEFEARVAAIRAELSPGLTGAQKIDWLFGWLMRHPGSTPTGPRP